MKRRKFLTAGALSVMGGALTACDIKNAREAVDKRDSSGTYPELDQHKIERYELLDASFHWPRFVGRNGRIDYHGQHHTHTLLKLYTDKGATGWGLSAHRAKGLFHFMQGKKVSELIDPRFGLRSIGLDQSVEFALFDLCGKILNQPVYKLIGNEGDTAIPIYSGMIYFDELNPENPNKNLDIILENCRWDYNHGYRQLKVKVGRSGRWYPHDEGLKKDIEVMKLIHDAFRGKDTELLIDANDMYNLDDTKRFLEGIGDIPLFWVEEPFRESLEDGVALRQWMNENGFGETLYADGEHNPDFDICLSLGKKKALDLFIPDTFDYGFSRWIQMMPYLKEIGMRTSPHAWGDQLKSYYTAHLGAGLGNVVNVEGVTCNSDVIDFSKYQIIDGKLQLPDAPGFGMDLRI